MRDESPTTKRAVLLDTAKHRPCAPPIIAVLMPITSPDDATSGPPELPGFSAASVWITSSIRRPCRERSDRPSAETTPAVTVDSKPSGLPIAMTRWPRRNVFESPSARQPCHPGYRLEQCEIGIGIVAEHVRLGRMPVGERHFHPTCASDDVAVRHDQTVAGDDDARPQTGAAVRAGRLNANHGVADVVRDLSNDARIGVERRFVAAAVECMALMGLARSSAC